MSEDLKEIYLHLHKSYGDDVKLYDGLIIMTLMINGHPVTFEISGYTTILAYSNESEYFDDIHRILLSLDTFDGNTSIVPTKVIQLFIKELKDESGFDDTIDVDDSKIDETYWDFLKSKAIVDRKIVVHTFGNKFKQYDHWCHKVDHAFNALMINSAKPKGCNLRDARGTDDIIKKAVRSGSGFEYFMTSMVESIEANNYGTIGIYCKAGHHRSVACAELLKDYIYPNARVEHLTINK
jgi:hypothetical protein